MDAALPTRTRTPREARTPSRRPARRRLAAAATVAAVSAGVLAVSAPAQAAGGGYNPSLTYGWTWGDCSVYVGVVRDVYSPWAAIAGASTSCSARHASTVVTVVELFNGAVVSGSAHTTTWANSYGTGGKITETPRFCGAGNWAQRATITVSGWGTYTFTTPAAYAQTGC